MTARSIRAVLCLALLAASLAPAPAAHALPQNAKVQTYKGGLNFPIDMVWVRGTKKIFFTEKSGAIRVMKGRTLLQRPCANLPVNSSGERGALGLALHPNFKNNKKLYVYYTNALPLENRVSRFIVKRNRCTRERVVVGGLHAASATNHNGGHLEFVKGKLFVSVGENADPSRSQNTADRLGKILRVTPGGRVPAGNPFGNEVWAYGQRNPFGLASKPGTNKIYASENGPNCDDELNFIKKGRNYGWGPAYVCGTAGVGPNPKPPLVRWSQIIVPTDPGWYKGRMPALSGDLYMGDFQGRLHRFVMNDRGNGVLEDRIIHRADNGIVDVSKGPGKWLYFMTTNAIKRVVPK
ncbi:MAG: PQQ-dependent sugar dehydrogenase [Actinomycetota bacterium]